MTDVSGILPPDARTTYEADGFVQAGRLLTDAEADALAAVIADMADDEAHPDHDRLYDMGVDGQPLLHLKNMWAQHPAFSEVIHRPEIAQILYALTGRRRHRLWQDGFFYKPPRTGSAHAWHQDLRRIPVAPGAEHQHHATSGHLARRIEELAQPIGGVREVDGGQERLAHIDALEPTGDRLRERLDSELEIDEAHRTALHR